MKKEGSRRETHGEKEECKSTGGKKIRGRSKEEGSVKKSNKVNRNWVYCIDEKGKKERKIKNSV